MKKIYLSVPLQTNRNQNISKTIYQILQDLGCKVISSWVIWDDPNPNLNPMEIYQRDYEAIKACDLLIAEVTKPSTGVGMEIMLASTFHKKIICLHKKSRLSNMIKGLPGIVIFHYKTKDDLKLFLKSEIIYKNCNSINHRINKEEPTHLARV